MDRLDQAAKDGAFRLTQYLQLYPLPNMVKSASYTNVSRTDLPDTEFAYVGTPRQFPCNSPEATLVSYMFYLEKAGRVNQEDQRVIEQRFNHFGNAWNVKKAMADLAKRRAEITTKEAGISDNDFALVVAVDGNKRRHYPLRNPSEVKEAAAWFVRNDNTLRDVYEFPLRVGMARQILNKAAAFNITLPAEQVVHLTKSSAAGIQLPSKVAEQIERRVKLATKAPPEVKEALLITRDFIKNHPYRVVEDELAIKIADTLEKFDRRFLHDEPYSERFASPEDALFGLSIKQAADMVNNCCALLSGTAYDKNDFKLLSLSEIKEAFGEEFADSVRSGVFVSPTKMAEVAVTLPLPDARQLDRLMELAGIQPIEKSAADFNDQLRKDLTAITQAIGA